MATAEAAPTIFTATSAYSLAFVTVVAVVHPFHIQAAAPGQRKSSLLDIFIEQQLNHDLRLLHLRVLHDELDRSLVGAVVRAIDCPIHAMRLLLRWGLNGATIVEALDVLA